MAGSHGELVLSVVYNVYMKPAPLNPIKIIFLLAVFCLASGIVISFIFSGDSEPFDPNQYTDLNPTTDAPRPEGIEGDGFLTIGPNEVVIPDVRTRLESESLGSDLYTLTAGNTDVSPYNIVYSDVDGSFAVVLSREPLADTRLLMESELKGILNLSESEICELNIYVGTTFDVNPFFSGQNLGLSFCDDSVLLQ